jgi:predicted nucleic acid-binding protein
MSSRTLVLDANILIRGVFGIRIRELLIAHEGEFYFCTPFDRVTEARKHVPRIARQKKIDAKVANADLDRLLDLFVNTVDSSLYYGLKQRALARIGKRDPADWPVLATALLLNAPLWTEDRDFFGTGVATWATSNIEIYLSNG